MKPDCLVKLLQWGKKWSTNVKISTCRFVSPSPSYRTLNQFYYFNALKAVVHCLESKFIRCGHCHLMLFASLIFSGSLFSIFLNFLFLSTYLQFLVFDVARSALY